MSNWVLQLIKLVSLGLIDITPEPKSRFWFSNDSYLHIYTFFFLVHWDKGTKTAQEEMSTRPGVCCLLTKLMFIYSQRFRDQGFAVSSISISYPWSSPPIGLLPVGTLSKGLHLHILLLLRLFFVSELLATLHIGIKLLLYMTTLVAEKDSLHGCLVPRSP